MRARTKLRLVPNVPEERSDAAYQPVAPVDKQAKEFLVRAHGVRTSAWLLWKHRKALRKYGYQEFRIPKKEGIPRWYWIAMEYLKAHRKKRWIVLEKIEGDTRVFLVKWKRFGKCKR